MSSEKAPAETDTARFHKRRAQIVAAAVDLFAEQGYYRTTIQEVAQKAGVSIGLIYRYAKDKEDLLELTLLSVLESYQRDIPAALTGVSDPLERVWTILDAYCRVVAGRREATVLNYRSTKSLPAARRETIKACEIETNALIEECLGACIDQGLFRPVNVQLVTYQFVTFAHAWALKHWRLRELCSLDDYISQGFEFFMAALLTVKGRQRYQVVFPQLATPGEWGETGAAHQVALRQEVLAAGAGGGS